MNPPAKKVRLDPGLSQMMIPPITPSDDMEDLYGTPPATSEVLTVNTEIVGKGPRDVNSINIETRHFNLPGLEPCANGTFTTDALERLSKMKEEAENGTHTMLIKSAPTKGLLGVFATIEGVDDGTVAITVDRNGTSDDTLKITTISPISHSSLLSSPQINRSPKAMQDSILPIAQLAHNPLQAGSEYSKSEIAGEPTVPNIDSGSVIPNALLDLQANDIPEVQKNNGGSLANANNRRSTSPKQAITPTIPNIVDVTITNQSVIDFSQDVVILGEGEAEFEMDSSPIQSSSSESSDSSTDDSDSDEGDYELLDPEEQVRRLMREDGGSDDDAGKATTNGASKGQLRTVNEKVDEVVVKPDVVITSDMKIEELGSVETIVENIVLIKAKVSGEYQVLETGSVLCLEDQTVIGSVAETLGRVQQPLYSVRFTNAEAIKDAGIFVGTRTFYVALHSTYVFTQPLKAFKGSDASNIYDEEVNEDELEFSDDEAELEHKHIKKQQRQSRRGGTGGLNDNFARGPRQKVSPVRQGDGMKMKCDNTTINYDDVVQDDEPYTPLVRPANLHEMMNKQENVPNARWRNEDSSKDRIWGRGRGRGGHDRKHGDYSNSGRDRGRDRGSHRGGSEGRNFQDRKNSGHHPLPLLAPPTTGVPPHPPASLYSAMAPSQPQILNTFQYQQNLPVFLQNEQNFQNYSHNMYQQFAHPLNDNYNKHIQPYQSSSGPSYSRPHVQNQHNQYSRPQNSYPYPQSSLAIPPGAYVNPAFFNNQSQTYQGQAHQIHSPLQQTYQQQSPFGGMGTCSQSQSRMSPESNAAFRAAQEKLNVLRQFSRGSGPPST